jgi:hypothetical protein
MRTKAEQAYAELCDTAAFKDFEGWADENNVTLSLADHNELDQLMFICETCGWWCDIAELNDQAYAELICDQCATE